MRVLIADDHPLFRDALRHVANQAIEGVDCQEAHDFEQARAAIRAGEPFDLILLDLNMPGMNGFTGLLDLRALSPETPVVIVSAEEEPHVVERALTCGAMGYIAKSAPRDAMVQAIRAVLAGEIVRPPASPPSPATARRAPPLLETLGSLTRRQRMVLTLLAQGKSNKQIAYELAIGDTTVKAHMTAILRKLKVTSRTQAVIIARQLGPLLARKG